tara:strand:- start:289769 stop:290737 length:969 start_codon:yes stop_codon:yes gene_type:complete
VYYHLNKFFILLLGLFIALSVSAEGINPSLPSFYLSNEYNYLNFKTKYRFSSKANPTSIIRGTGEDFGSLEKDKYCIIKGKTQSIENYRVQWILDDLSMGQRLANSLSPERLFYGASLSKVFVAGAYLNSPFAKFDRAGHQYLLDMIVESNNSSWKILQQLSGGSSVKAGMIEVDRFLKDDLGITKSTGFRGDLNGVHGNEISAKDVADFLRLTVNYQYSNSEKLIKAMFLSRTGSKRARKYLPKSLIVGGKTGTYNGATRLNKKPIQSKAKHHSILIYFKSRILSLSILSDPGIDEEIAILAGGILREYIQLDNEGIVSCE